MTVSAVNGKPYTLISLSCCILDKRMKRSLRFAFVPSENLNMYSVGLFVLTSYTQDLSKNLKNASWYL